MQRCRSVIGFVLVLIALGVLQGPLVAVQAREGGPTLDHFLYLPSVTANLALSDILPVIPETTAVLDDLALQTLESVSDEGTFTFSESSLVEELQPNDVMVGEPSPAAPYGFLRRVEAVSTSNGQMLVETGGATLEDAIQDGTLRVSQALSPAQVVQAQLAEGVRLERQPASSEAEFFVTLNDVVLYDHDGDPATDDQIRADGSLTLEPHVDLLVDLQHGRIENLSFSTTLEKTADLRIEASIQVDSLQRQKEVARYHLSPTIAYVGIVPVVLAPVITINVGVDGEARVGITTRVTQNATATAGVEYTSSTWRGRGNLTNNFSYDRPTPFASLKVKGYLGPQLSLLLYGIAGPYVNTNGYLELDANTSNRPWWNLYGGLEATSGVRMELLSESIESPDIAVIGFRGVLASAPYEENSSVTFVRVERNSTDPGLYDVVWVTNNEADRGTTQFAVTRQRADETPYILGLVSPDGDGTYRFTDTGTANSGGVPLPHYKYRIVEFQGQPYPAFQLGPVRLGEAWP